MIEPFHNPESARPLNLLPVVIPARDEEGCISSTVERLHVELQFHNIPHEIDAWRPAHRELPKHHFVFKGGGPFTGLFSLTYG
jgi:hypothetical protein